MKKVKLGEICEIVTGSTPKSSNPNYWNGEYKWITPAEISDDDFIVFDTQRKITKLGIEETGLKSFPTGTVLLSSRAPIGKVAISGCEMYCNQGFKNFICSNKINNEYLYYFFKARKNYLNILGRGATFKEISKSIVSDIEIFLPTYDIQRKQVKVLKKIDKLIYTREEQLIEFEYLVKSRFNEMFGDPVLNEMGWNKHALKEFGIWKSGGTPKRNEEEFFRGNIPWITSGELEHKYIEDSFEKITEKAIECSSAKIIEKGSLLLGMYDTAGLKSSINTKIISCNQAIAFAKLDDKITNTIYVYYVIQNLRSTLLNQQRGVRQKNFNLSMIKNISIPLPPLALQNEFADFVAQVDKSQLAIQKSLEELETLKKSLMQEYFG
ncbi:restriction endonuclease subunit S [Streptococcus pneumoniae]|uniref:restriction endonuclease subunit S n=1 Tax=Streptococcus pneumoniae TaxID=1313 RepID=UPI0005E3E395|nr:restriction endonuclease subunit S [Streptococcus pneumoniae]CKJ45610.1 type I restriction-modification system S subunit [Streptococcus pneumoniae]